MTAPNKPRDLKVQPLDLSRETVAELTEEEAEKAHGGVFTYGDFTCAAVPSAVKFTCHVKK